MLINKAFKTEIHINNSLQRVFNQAIGNRRFVYNHLLNIVDNSPISKVCYTIKSLDENSNEIYENKLYSITSKKVLQDLGSYLSNNHNFLKLSHSQSLQEASHALEKAFVRFNKLRTKLNSIKGKPRFKSKREESSFYLPNQNNIFLFDNYIEIKPFDKFLKSLIDKNQIKSFRKIWFKNSIPKDLLDASITGINISKSKGKYFIAINYKYENNISTIDSNYIEDYVNNLSDRIVGIDLGLKDKLILSDGTKYHGINNSIKYQKLIANQKLLQKSISKMVEKKKKLELAKRYKDGYRSISKKDIKRLDKSRKKDKYRDNKKFDLYKLFLDNKLTILERDYKFDSKFWKKTYKDKKIKSLGKELFKYELKLKNIRKNENHKISKQIVDNNDFIFMEDLSLKGMQSLWGNKIKQLGLNQLVNFIKYKAENQGKIFYKIGRFYPSSKTCSCCGIKKNLTLSDRIYRCENCDLVIDRDVNASINILSEGIKNLIVEKELNPSTIRTRDFTNHLIKVNEIVDGGDKSIKRFIEKSPRETMSFMA